VNINGCIKGRTIYIRRDRTGSAIIYKALQIWDKRNGRIEWKSVVGGGFF